MCLIEQVRVWFSLQNRFIRVSQSPQKSRNLAVHCFVSIFRILRVIWNLRIYNYRENSSKPSKEIKNTKWNARWQYLLIIRMLPSHAYDRKYVAWSFYLSIFRYTLTNSRAIGVHRILRTASLLLTVNNNLRGARR